MFLPLVFGKPIPIKMLGKLGAFRKDLEDNSRLSASWVWLFSVGLVVGWCFCFEVPDFLNLEMWNMFHD